MRKVLTIVLILIAVSLTGCSTSPGFVDDQLKPLLQNGVYIHSFDALADEDVIFSHPSAIISVYPVDEEKKPVRELTRINVGRNATDVATSNIGEGYSIKVSKIFEDETVKEPKLVLDSSNEIKLDFMDRLFCPSNQAGKRNAVECYAVKLYMPKDYSIPDKFKKIFVASNPY